MYISNSLSFYGTKHLPLAGGIAFLSIAIWTFIDSYFGVNYDQILQNETTSSIWGFIIFSVLLLSSYFIVGRKVIQISLGNKFLKFNYKGKEITKKWSDVEFIKRYWLIAPPLYSIKFEGDNNLYFFNSGFAFLITPFYTFDLSSMGNYIKQRKKEIPYSKI